MEQDHSKIIEATSIQAASSMVSSVEAKVEMTEASLSLTSDVSSSQAVMAEASCSRPTCIDDLPPELLLQIFKNAVTASSPVLARPCSYPVHLHRGFLGNCSIPPELREGKRLHLVCRLFHKLLSEKGFRNNSIFYSQNRFRFSINLLIYPYSKYLLPEQLYAVQRVEICIRCSWFNDNRKTDIFKLFRYEGLRYLKLTIIITYGNEPLGHFGRLLAFYAEPLRKRIGRKRAAGLNSAFPKMRREDFEVDLGFSWRLHSEEWNELRKELGRQLERFNDELRDLFFPPKLQESSTESEDEEDEFQSILFPFETLPEDRIEENGVEHNNGREGSDNDKENGSEQSSSDSGSGNNEEGGGPGVPTQTQVPPPTFNQAQGLNPAGNGPQIVLNNPIFNSPVFIGYPTEQAMAFMKRYQSGGQ